MVKYDPSKNYPILNIWGEMSTYLRDRCIVTPSIVHHVYTCKLKKASSDRKVESLLSMSIIVPRGK